MQIDVCYLEAELNNTEESGFEVIENVDSNPFYFNFVHKYVLKIFGLLISNDFLKH